MISFTVILRAATKDFYCSRLPQWQQHFWCAAGFYVTESRHNCGLANTLSCGDANTILINKRHDRWFGCETIHHTQKFTSMNLLQITCVIPWAWSFLTCKVVEAVRGQKHHILAHTLALGSSQSASSAYQRFTKKWDQIWLSASIQLQKLEF